MTRCASLRTAFVVLVVAALVAACGAGPRDLVVAAGTTLVDSGFLDPLVREFETRSGVNVKLVAVTSAEAFRLGEQGAADVLLTFDAAGEARFMETGRGRELYPFVRNDFVIAGPPDDPGGIRGLGAVNAFRRLVTQPFVSRDDGSGTHLREQALWDSAGVTPRHRIGAGASAGATLQIANERRGYTLTDHVMMRSFQATVDLAILVEGDTALANRYSIILVTPQGSDARTIQKQSDANAFVTFLLDRAQEHGSL